MARLLPNHLLVDLLERKRLLLCLDFDGTIAATTANPDDARPVEGVADVLRALSSHREDVVLAIVSGRDVRTASRMLGVSGGLYFVGLHGIELLDPDNHRELLVQVKHCLGALHTVREWLAKVARTADGFKIEDKECSLALHFRNVDPETARDICRQLEYFVVHMIRGLRVIYGDMAVEVVPSNASGKGFAINHLLAQLRDKSLMPVYFGNDTSDEEAFFAVRRVGGATILVGPDRDTHAEYRVDTPEDVAAALTRLADALEDHGASPSA